MRKLALLLCLGVLTHGGPAQAASALGIGTRDCAAFLQASEMDSTQALDGYVSWSLGYLTGRNAAATHGRQVVVDGGSLVHWLTAWCGTRSGTPIFEAIEIFAPESGG